MKNYILKTLILSIIFLFSSVYVKGATIITSPIDSRPISTDYLGNLASIAGDKFISVSKENLDYFSAVDADNHFADSKKVREELKEIVKNNNTEDTTVIINTSSYITNGLVGSRCGINYVDYEDALNDLYSLITENHNPSYYINLSMPRTLPETRFNTIWRTDNNEPLVGLGYYYLQYNKDTPLKEYITKKLSYVNASQFLLEWSYIENKKKELGEEFLQPWEKDFLYVFNRDYKFYEPYKSYVYKYKLPYYTVSTMLRSLLRWQKEGLLDEIIISNDDFQLPDSIIYIYNNSNENWITLEKETPVKFSFARTYMTTGITSITNQIEDFYGEDEIYLALKGLSDKVNFVFGTDEVPQLIYARDLSKRLDLSSDINIIKSSDNDIIEKFDVMGVDQLLKSGVNFVKASKKKTDKQFDLFVFDYIDKGKTKVDDMITKMENSFSENDNVGLIEIFRSDTLNTGENNLFKQLLANAENQLEISVSDLSCYSAWNTNANAIGLGIAHAQVYGISEQKTENPINFIKAQTKMLSQHIFEDGIYTIQCKRLLANEGFVPSKEDRIKSDKLYSILNVDEITRAINKKIYTINEKSYKIDSLNLVQYNFPWGRNFECFLDFDVNISETIKDRQN